MAFDYTIEVTEPNGDVLVFPGDPVATVEIEVPSAIETVEIIVQGPQGPAGPAGATYVHTQSSAAATWNVAHNLGTIPAVVLMPDSDPGVQQITDITHTDLNNFVVTWPSPESGKAYCK